METVLKRSSFCIFFDSFSIIVAKNPFLNSVVLTRWLGLLEESVTGLRMTIYNAFWQLNYSYTTVVCVTIYCYHKHLHQYHAATTPVYPQLSSLRLILLKAGLAALASQYTGSISKIEKLFYSGPDIPITTTTMKTLQATFISLLIASIMIASSRAQNVSSLSVVNLQPAGRPDMGLATLATR